ncbi:MAG: histone acetyltransferase 1 [Ramalina farinacea]|uniref:Histone acetyltransferase type B catalytic subunit n=1 Tax=Ramalina farinacea TaxID=258253 RepID=A0AA43TV24_9LECA|nr:histone acetyltransferase 1 [Ramalina farinacea]
MEDQDAWSVNASEAVKISIVQPGETSPTTLAQFPPQFTYSIFGDEERIFGYQGLKIDLNFAAHDLTPNLKFGWDKKFQPVGETEATDLEETLRPFTIDESFSSRDQFNKQVQESQTAKDFKPPGELFQKYTSKGRQFEIWYGELSDPTVKLLISRIQILIAFFIEGGTLLDLDDQEWSLARWRVYFVYEITKPSVSNASPYSIVGYSTSYRFIPYTPSTMNNGAFINGIHDFSLPPNKPLHPSSIPSRIRISQFLILPCHHSHGHGSHLFEAMTKTMLASSTCTEITVEDPNEAFDDLRDYCDYARLSANGTFSQIRLNISIDPKLSANRIGVRVPTSHLLDLPLLEKLRLKNKIAPRQFYRLVEMHLFSKIAPAARHAGSARLTQRGRTSNLDDRAFYYWRLLVKQRIYKRNKDVLIQLDRAERADKVEQTLGEVAGDYERLLRGMQKWKEAEEKSHEVDEEKAGRSGERRDRGKRKIVEDEDDSDIVMTGAKRARSEAL